MSFLNTQILFCYNSVHKTEFAGVTNLITKVMKKPQCLFFLATIIYFVIFILFYLTTLTPLISFLLNRVTFSSIFLRPICPRPYLTLSFLKSKFCNTKMYTYDLKHFYVTYCTVSRFFIESQNNYSILHKKMHY